MRTERGASWLAAVLLLAAAAATTVATWLHWQPCRGTMLNGSILYGYDARSGWSDACLRRMDGGPPFPYPAEPAEQTAYASELGVVAVVLAALAWLVFVLGSRWSGYARLVALTPTLATGVVITTAVIALRDPARDPDSYPSLGILWAPELALVVTLLVLRLGRTDLRGRRLLRAVLLLWGTTAFGLVHIMTEYSVMVALHEANWDSPPGTGYLTALVLAAAAVGTVLLSGRPPATAAPARNPVHAPVG